jgi:mono/diheme cytochrome c family protein
MPRINHEKAAKGMSSLRIPTVVLAAALMITSSLYAQTPTAPEVNLPAGDVARGKAIFQGTKGNCTSCHRVNGAGSRFAPDLSAIGAPPRGGGGGRGNAPAPAPAPARGGFGGDEVANAAIGRVAAATPVPPIGGDATVRQLAQSILDPNALVAVANRYVVLKMKDGKSVTAKLLSVDTFYYQIFDSSEKLANIPKENVREMTMTSPMPSYKDKLSTQELADVISYLMSLKGQ